MKKPTFLYGTAWKEADTERCVSAAIRAGFRAIDTANQRKHYFEEGVGAALRKALDARTVAREDLFIQTKFTSLGGQDSRLPYETGASATQQVKQSFASSLIHLGVDHIDSYILHGPSRAVGLSDHDWEVWRAIEALKSERRVGHIGISNVSAEQLELLIEKAALKPDYVQNRCYARRGWDHDVREICDAHGIVYQGFSLLTANDEIFGHKKFQQLTQQYQCTPAQLVFAFARSVGMLPLTGTTDPSHMSEDLKSELIQLKPEDSKAILRISAS